MKKPNRGRGSPFNGEPVVLLQVAGGRRRAHVERKCEVCGKAFLIRVDFVRAGLGRGCSLQCRGLIGFGLKERKPKTDSRGYRYIYRPSHPRAYKGKGWMKGYVKESVLVAEQKLGRSLRADEVVHHLNADKGDNRPVNLEVMTATKHNRLHGVRGFTPCRFCGKI